LKPSPKDTITEQPSIRAVRGPLSRDLVVSHGFDCPKVYGDPALVLPEIYQPEMKKKYKVGIIPHYTDLFQIHLHKRLYFPKDVKLINILDEVETVIDNVNRCEKIISTSLHGLILANAYGIPSRWIECSDGVLGDGFKFCDYLASVGIDIYSPDFIHLSDLDKFDFYEYNAYNPSIDLGKMREKLLKVCPL